MLTYILSDINDRKSTMNYPLSVSYVSSEDAPADSLTVVFAVNESIYPIVSIIVENEGKRIFSGLVDSQTEQQTSEGVLLTITARSLECILLDNEALPQTYCMPSMPLIFKRHLEVLGFKKYIGTDKAFNGEMIISKGMSEWSVLEMFCRRFLKTVPKIDCFGVIDVSGKENDEVVYISDSGKNRCISKKRILNRSCLVSDILARTCISGGYEMPLENTFAQQLGVKRRRYVNSIDSESRSVLDTKKILENSVRNYEQFVLKYSGCILCGTGATVVLQDSGRKLRVKEIHYNLNSNGETTTIYAEAKN